MIWLVDILKIYRRTAADEVLCDKVFNIAKNSTYDKYCFNAYGLLQWFINFLIKETLVRTIQKEIIQNEVLAKELRKPIIKRFEKKHSS